MKTYRPRTIVPAPAGSVWMDEAARRLGISLATLRKWRLKGIGPHAYTVGRRKLAYEIEAIDAYLAGRRAQASNESVAA